MLIATALIDADRVTKRESRLECVNIIISVAFYFRKPYQRPTNSDISVRTLLRPMIYPRIFVRSALPLRRMLLLLLSWEATLILVNLQGLILVFVMHRDKIDINGYFC